MVVGFFGDVEPQASAIRAFLNEQYVNGVLKEQYLDLSIMPRDDGWLVGNWLHRYQFDLFVVAGWRHLLSPVAVKWPRLGTVGFHSAKLPEYPGRAPIPWTLLRGETLAWNTMLYLDEGVDSGDVIDAESRVIQPDDTPESLYEWVAESDVRLLRRHLAGILAGTAPRTPQDPAKRGPLTTKDGWQLLAAR